MKWRIPPDIKVYEAFGCLADGRLREEKGEIRVYSSSGNKFYIVLYDAKQNAIMTNDNGTYWKGYMGYPAIAFLMSIGKIQFQEKHSVALKDIPWKDVNTKNKNDFEKTKKDVHKIVVKRGFDLNEFKSDVKNIMQQIVDLGMEKLGKRMRPPNGY